MNAKPLLGFFCIFSLLVSSCGPSEEGSSKGIGLGEEKPPTIVDGPDKTFWALNIPHNRFYRVEATLRGEGQHCKIWVEKNLQVENSKLSELISEYDGKIRPALLNAFSVKGPVADPQTHEVVAEDSLGWADYLGDGDEKLSILILDIASSNANSFVAGYFMPGNFYASTDFRNPDYRYSNESDMIYLNASAESEHKRTLAHETQHLMNFANSALLRRYYDPDLESWDVDPMDIWIDEGLSSAAEYIYSGQQNERRIEEFTFLMPGSELDKGNNFFVWGERPGAILDEYTTVYLFFQWLRLQSGSTQIYKDISISESVDYRSVLHAIQGKGNYSNDNNLTWAALLRDWLLANTLTTDDFTAYPSGTRSSSAKHGYMKDTQLSKIGGVWFYPLPAEGSVMLYPGEGVYSWTNTSGTYSDSNNIKYTGIRVQTREAELRDGSSLPGGILMSYNVNTLNMVVGDIPLTSLRESAQISPDSPPRSNQSLYAIKSMLPSQVSKPQPISIWDMLRLNKDTEASASSKLLGLGLRGFGAGIRPRFLLCKRLLGSGENEAFMHCHRGSTCCP